MSFEEKIQLVRSNIKDGWELSGSQWNKCETEVIALQTISACGLNLEKHGDAFSWQGRGTLRGDNFGAVRTLIHGGYLRLEPYDNPQNLPVPETTVIDEKTGRPMVFRCKEELLDYAIKFMGLDEEAKV